MNIAASSLIRHLSRYVKPKPEHIIDNIVCLDLEATCDSPNQLYPQEVIEIACYKLNLSKSTDEPSCFHSFVRPTVYPALTSFCKQMTGITQSDVDESETLDKVYYKLLDWMGNQNLIEIVTNDNTLPEKPTTIIAREKFAFATCGNYDMDYLVKNCKLFDIELPIYFKQWINVKKSFFNHKKVWPSNLYSMLEVLELRQEGSLHRAKDDCHNLALIVKKLHALGYEYHFTNSMICNKS